MTANFDREIIAMNESHFNEIERALLHISDARERTARAATALEKDGAEGHLSAALRDAEEKLGELGKVLTQRTYFAVSEDGSPEQDRLAV
ncbi:MAG TPA: hypothetical protein VNT32_03095 [Thermoleophilaceae bacterium]|nr:hypothetical protein [Thermoleophilaceae bacterium]